MLLEFLYHQTGLIIFNSRLFSTGIATIISFACAIVFFQPYISFLKKIHCSSELVSDKESHQPVMPAGILFFFIITLITLITARFNSYVLSALVIYVFFSVIGAIDDIAKVLNKGRLARGEISKEDYQYKSDGISASLRLTLYLVISLIVAAAAYKYIPGISGHITIPFISAQKSLSYLPMWIFIPFMALTIAVMANGVNFTDGFDTLASVPLLTCATFVGIVAYVSSNSGWSSYLLIPFIPGLEEVLPLIGAVIGTLLAFLWYNSPPSSIIMGDSGSVGLGGLIGILFIFIKAGFYLPIVGFIFFIEFLSDIIQIGYFKMTRKRVFLMAPIHHHFQIKMRRKPQYTSEFHIKSKITWRFHIISFILLVVGLTLFFKVR
ncbi:MAG: phospho-N-acetylmuramoyl-pentapeptide-transferase [Fibrobacterota bacterium]